MVSKIGEASRVIMVGKNQEESKESKLKLDWCESAEQIILRVSKSGSILCIEWMKR